MFATSYMWEWWWNIETCVVGSVLIILFSSVYLLTTFFKVLSYIIFARVIWCMAKLIYLFVSSFSDSCWSKENSWVSYDKQGQNVNLSTALCIFFITFLSSFLQLASAQNAQIQVLSLKSGIIYYPRIYSPSIITVYLFL